MTGIMKALETIKYFEEKNLIKFLFHVQIAIPLFFR